MSVDREKIPEMLNAKQATEIKEKGGAANTGVGRQSDKNALAAAMNARHILT